MVSGPLVELVFHPVGTDAESTRFGDAIEAVLDGTVGSVRLVSPYIGYKILERVTRGRDFELVTDLDECFANNRGKPLIKFFMQNLARIKHVRGVHAKMISTDNSALIGSANLTERGCADRDELGCLIRDATLVAVLGQWFRDLWEAGDDVSREAVNAAKERAMTLAKAVAQAKTKQKRVQPKMGPRRLGAWLSQSAPAAPTANHGPLLSASEEIVNMQAWDDVVSRLQSVINSYAHAILVIDLLAEALDVSGLSESDVCLYVGCNASTPIQVNISGRAVAWTGSRGGLAYFGMLLDSPSLAKKMATFIPGARIEKFSTSLGLKLPLDMLAEQISSLRESWHSAIMFQTQRKAKSTGEPFYNPYRNRYHQPGLYQLLVNQSQRHEVVRAAFPTG